MQTSTHLPSLMIGIISIVTALYGAFVIVSAMLEFRWLRRSVIARTVIAKFGIGVYKITYLFEGAFLIALGIVLYLYLVPYLADLQGKIGLVL